jgi:hypothetical protein
MACPRGLAHPGAVDHITRRGHTRQRLDAYAADRETLLAVPEAVGRRDHWRGPALCLMDTHDLLVLVGKGVKS